MSYVMICMVRIEELLLRDLCLHQLKLVLHYHYVIGDAWIWQFIIEMNNWILRKEIGPNVPIDDLALRWNQAKNNRPWKV